VHELYLQRAELHEVHELLCCNSCEHLLRLWSAVPTPARPAGSSEPAAEPSEPDIEPNEDGARPSWKVRSSEFRTVELSKELNRVRPQCWILACGMQQELTIRDPVKLCSTVVEPVAHGHCTAPAHTLGKLGQEW
jgi:hypothetical protein